MRNFRRDIYKLTKSPKPPKPSPQIVWYRSISQVKGTADFCLPITTQIFKNPNTIPVQVGDFVYTDFQQTSPLVPQNGGTETVYNIANQSLPNPVGQSNIKSIEVNNSGEILSIIEGDCNPQLNLQSVYITEVAPTGGEACSRLLITYQVKVHSDFIDNGIVLGGAQLYTQSSTNFNPQPLNPVDIPNSIYTGFNAVSNTYIGIGTTSSLQNTQPTASFNISSNGVISNPNVC